MRLTNSAVDTSQDKDKSYQYHHKLWQDDAEDLKATLLINSARVRQEATADLEDFASVSHTSVYGTTTFYLVSFRSSMRVFGRCWMAGKKDLGSRNEG